MATKVEMSFCALCGSGSEISWHLDVPFFFLFWCTASAVHWRKYKHTPRHCPIPTSFCSQYESLDSSYSSCVECQRSVRYVIGCPQMVDLAQ